MITGYMKSRKSKGIADALEYAAFTQADFESF